MELSDAHLLEALKLLPAAEQRSFDVCLAAEIETVQDRMRLAAVAAAAAKTEKAAAAKEKEKAAAAAKREKEKMAAVARAVVEAMAEAAASMTQAAMRAAVEAGIETRQEAARAAALRGKPFAKCSWREGGRQRDDALRARANVEARELRVAAAAAELACPSPTVQNLKQMGRIATRREFRLRELATRPPSGKRLFKVRSERASKRPRGARGKFESKPTAAVVSAIAHAGAAIAISPTAISAAAKRDARSHSACVTIPAARFSAPATLAAECTFVRFC